MATTIDATDDQEMAEVSPENDDLLPGFKDVSTFSQQALGQLMQATKTAHRLPACGDDYDFYSSFDSFRGYCHNQSERLLQMINGLMGQQGSKTCLMSGSSAPELEDKTDAIIETNDTILEKVGLLLDEASGLIKPGKTALPPGSKPQVAQKLLVASWNKQNETSPSRKFHLMHAKNISRPQLKFKDKIDNTNTPFIPIITNKPNALKPLNKVSVSRNKNSTKSKDVPDAVSSFIHQQRVSANENDDITAHPYQYELNHFTPLPSTLLPVDSPSYAPLDSTPLTLVDTADQLQELSHKLDFLKEVAVDLEHHSYRSFQGFTCLMQISTGNHDYIIDTLALRSDLHILNNSFTNPAIVKVFHGADMDIQWLQRDFGLYVVNMFDTGQASRILGKARHSLAHLLQLYCGVSPDKSFQLADWRIRPLPQEMINYSREDTHYLLFIYHRLKNELIERGNEANNLLLQTVEQSRQVCLRRYKKQLFTDDAYLELWKRNRKPFNPKQYEALKLLYAWRDNMARQEDESTGYVLPNHMLFQIAENLPREAHGVLACCNPIPPLIRQQLNEVHQLILTARAYQGHTKKLSASPQTLPSPSRSDTPTPVKTALKPLNRLLYCPHDPTPQEVIPANHGHYLPNPVAHYSTLLGDEERPQPVQTAKPIITAFDSSSEDEESSKVGVAPTSGQQKVARVQALFVNPFKMFLPPKQIIQIAPALLEADKINLSPAQTKEKSASSSSPSNEMQQDVTQNLWKLKKSTKSSSKSSQAKGKSKESTNTNNSGQTEGDKRGVIAEKTTAPESKTLRQQKRKATSADELAIMTYRPLPPKREKKSHTPSTNPPTNTVTEAKPFQPFDYSEVQVKGENYTDSHGSSRGRGRGSKGRGRGSGGKTYTQHFDPQSHASTRGRQEVGGKKRPKTHHLAGQRSMTYTKHDAGRGNHGKHHWPKR